MLNLDYELQTENNGDEMIITAIEASRSQDQIDQGKFMKATP